MQISQLLYRPIIWICNGTAKWLLKLSGQEVVKGHGNVHSLEEIEILVLESHEGGLLEDEQKQMLRNAFRLRDLIARQVMIHRTKMVTLPVTSSMDEILDLALEDGYTRIPLHQDNIDNIVGFVHVKDLFRLQANGGNDISKVMRKITLVPETMLATDVWSKLNEGPSYWRWRSGPRYSKYSFKKKCNFNHGYCRSNFSSCRRSSEQS